MSAETLVQALAALVLREGGRVVLTEEEIIAANGCVVQSTVEPLRGAVLVRVVRPGLDTAPILNG